MEGYYSIAQIAEKVGHSNQAIYKLISNNKELENILKENTVIIGKGKRYSQVILEWIINYYKQIESNETIEKKTNENTEQLENAIMRKEIEHLQEKLEILKEQLQEAKTEKDELRKQNSALMMLLAQEKDEKKQLVIESEQKEVQKVGVQEHKGLFARIFSKRK